MRGPQAPTSPADLIGGDHPYTLQIPKGKALTTDVVRDIGSPALNASAIHPELAKFVATRITGTTAQDQHGFAKLLDSFNRLSRIGLITNPTVHVGWILTNGFLAAGGDLRDLAGISEDRSRGRGGRCACVVRRDARLRRNECRAPVDDASE